MFFFLKGKMGVDPVFGGVKENSNLALNVIKVFCSQKCCCDVPYSQVAAPSLKCFN